MKTTDLIYSMLTENTGKALCDSGDAYGRNWQRNQAKTIADFEAEPSATIEVYKYEGKDGKTHWELSPTLSLYHHLTGALEQDDLCREFNAMECDVWNSDYYGINVDQQEWLENVGFTFEGDAWNSYNWSANFSQVVQGQNLELDGEKYVLLQIHGGCDVRGGYTDAKLFKLKCYCDALMMEYASYWVTDADGEELALDWSGCEWIDREGSCPDDDYLDRFAAALGVGVHEGEAIASLHSTSAGRL